jgi:hypothetical protein
MLVTGWRANIQKRFGKGNKRLITPGAGAASPIIETEENRDDSRTVYP